MKHKPRTGNALGSRLQYKFFELMVRCRAIPFARAMLAVVVLYYTLLPHVRRRCSAYLCRRFPDHSSWRMFGHAFRLYLHFGNILLDRMIAGTTGRFPICVTEPHVREVIEKSGQSSRGCIILSAHIGAWQIGLAGLEQFDRPVNVVQLRDPEDADKHYFQRGNGRSFHIIDSSDPMGSLVEVGAALKRGELVCLMGDRLPGEAKAASCVEVPFLGGIIRVPINAYALASITGADLLMLFTIRENGVTRALLAERIFVPSGLRRHTPSVFLPYAMQFVGAMESVITRYPYQFFNFYNMWQQHDEK